MTGMGESVLYTVKDGVILYLQNETKIAKFRYLRK
jgi:hypothetical protein